KGGRIRVTLSRDYSGDGEHAFAVVRVADNGAGIAPEMLSRVFDLFVQADRNAASPAGLGLGLTVARRLVELHHGTIEATSNGKGSGSEFVVRLPEVASPPRANSSRRAKGVAAGARRHILIVDDNEDAAASLRMMLALEGHQV